MINTGFLDEYFLLMTLCHINEFLVTSFLIGREKDPSKSEVARLIQQSLDQDRRREEMREKEQQRLRQLEDNFQVRHVAVNKPLLFGWFAELA